MSSPSGSTSSPSPFVSENTPLLKGSSGPTHNRDHGSIERGTDGDGPAERELDYSVILPIFCTMWIGTFLAALDGTLVMTLTGPISGSLKSFQSIAWIASSFFISTAASQPLAGRLTDIFGRQKGLLFSNICFGLGNLLCGISSTTEVMILGRVMSGVGAGGVMSINAFIMGDVIPIRDRGLWQSMANAVYCVGSTSGGFIGGFVHDRWGWRWAFLVQVPLIAMSGICVFFFVKDTNKPLEYLDDDDDNEPTTTTVVHNTNSASANQSLIKGGSNSSNSSNSNTNSGSSTPSNNPPAIRIRKNVSTFRKMKRVDFIGSITLVCSLVILLMALNLGGNFLPWSHPIVVFSIPLSLIIFGLFLHWELNVAKEPIVPVRLCVEPAVFGALMTMSLSTMAIMAPIFYFPLYFQARGYSTTTSGAFMINFAVGGVVGAFAIGMCIRATGKYMTVKYIMMGLQIVCFCGIYQYFTLSSSVIICSAIMLWTSISYNGILTFGLIALLSAVEHVHQAVITSACYAVRSVGATLGIAVATGVFQNLLRINLESRFGAEPGGADIIAKIREAGLDGLHSIPPQWRAVAVEVYVSSLKGVWITGAIIAILAGAVSFMIKQNDLGNRVRN